MRRCSHFTDFIVVMGLALCASGCSGSSSSSSTTNASAAGIWTGTDSASGLTLSGIVNAAGVADVIRSDGEQYVGTDQGSGAALAVTLDDYTQFGGEFSNGSTYGVAHSTPPSILCVVDSVINKYLSQEILRTCENRRSLSSLICEKCSSPQ